MEKKHSNAYFIFLRTEQCWATFCIFIRRGWCFSLQLNELMTADVFYLLLYVIILRVRGGRRGIESRMFGRNIHSFVVQTDSMSFI